MKRTAVTIAILAVLAGLLAAKCAREPVSTGGSGQVEMPQAPPADPGTRITNIDKGHWRPRP